MSTNQPAIYPLLSNRREEVKLKTSSLPNSETGGIEFLLPRDTEDDGAWGGPNEQVNIKALKQAVQSRVDDMRNGVYRVRWTATLTAYYDLVIRLGDGMVQQGKARVRIAPSLCDPGKSRGWGTGLRSGVAGAPANFYM